jgi:1,4-dihydroxy-6-naphthoate synthase
MAGAERTLAHSPDADDAFLFAGITLGRVDTRGFRFRSELRDIESLNRAAAEGRYDVTALSAHAYAHVRSAYRILTVGASVGDGYGPVLVSRRPMIPEELEEATVVIPGEWTTAALLLRIRHPTVRTKVLPFDSILDAVARGDADGGVVIHEGQLTYAHRRLVKVVDLGEWWSLATGMPVVLGVLAIRRTIPDAEAIAIAEVIRDSIRWALEHRAEALKEARKFARGADDATLDRFVGMYVNHYTLHLGMRGEQALEYLYRLGADAGVLDAPVLPDVIGPLP